MYDVYMDNVLLPVAPERIELRAANRNSVVNLINDGEMNILKKAGLTEIAFTALLPQFKYPFARYKRGFQPAGHYLEAFERLKTRRTRSLKHRPFQFIVSRAAPDGRVLFNTNMKVSLEDYIVREEAENGLDIFVDVSLKQYREYKTKKVEITKGGEAAILEGRPADSAPQYDTYTVAAGDTLVSIALRCYGDDKRYKDIYAANKALMDAANAGTGYSKITVYPGQALVLPD